MARAKQTKAKTSAGGQPVSYRRSFVTLILLAVIVYGLLFMACRTEGFRSFLSEKLETQLGAPVQIQDSRADFSLNLHLENVHIGYEDQPELGSVLLRKIYVEWSLVRWLRSNYHPVKLLRVEDFEVDLRPSEGSGWQPVCMTELTGWLSRLFYLDLEGKGSLPGKTRARAQTADADALATWSSIALEADKGRMTWKDQRGAEYAGMQGISIEQVDFQTRDRSLRYGRWSVQAISSRGVPRSEDSFIDWLFDGEQIQILQSRLPRP